MATPIVPNARVRVNLIWFNVLWRASSFHGYWHDTEVTHDTVYPAYTIPELNSVVGRLQRRAERNKHGGLIAISLTNGVDTYPLTREQIRGWVTDW